MLKILLSIIISVAIGAGIGYSYSITVPYATDVYPLPILYVGLGFIAIYIVSLLMFTKTIVLSFINILLSAFAIILTGFLTISFLTPDIFPKLYSINEAQIISSQVMLNLLSYIGIALGPILANIPVGMGGDKAGAKPKKKAPVKKEKGKKEEKGGKDETKTSQVTSPKQNPAAEAAAPAKIPEPSKHYEPIDIGRTLASIPGPTLAPQAPSFEAQSAFDRGHTVKMTAQDINSMFDETPASAAPTAPAPASNIGPVGESDFDSSFANLLSPEETAAQHQAAAMAPPPVQSQFQPPAQPNIPNIASEPPVAAAPQQPQGTGAEKISAKVVSDQASGKLNAGRMLIDEESISKIVTKEETREVITKAGLSSTRVISAAKGHTLDALLSDINSIPGVKGSIIVGRDGLLIDSTIKDATPKELIGAVGSSIYSNVEVATQRMQRGKLKQMFLNTDLGLTIVNELENLGLLIVLTDVEAESRLFDLLNAIRTTIEVSKMVGKRG